MASSLAAATVLAVGVGLAFARDSAATIGRGVVVIQTNLAYQGGAAAGTGMVLTPSGEVLTNNHVIRGASTIRIVVPGTGHSYRAKVLGYSVSGDVAVLKAVGASHLKTVSVGNSSTVTVGQRVTALGNAGGTGRLISAAGTVTGLGKSIVAGDGPADSRRLTGLIETNANVQPGDSGGPLFTTAGRVVGMNTAVSTTGSPFASSVTTNAYAIPIAKAVTIVKQIEAGRASATVHVGGTAFLGIQVGSPDYGAGAQIQDVLSGGPADRAGLASGDVITAVDGRTISSPSALTSLMATKRPGAKVTISYTDAYGSPQTATVTLGGGPPQ